MKVASDSTPISALGIWLPGVEPAPLPESPEARAVAPEIAATARGGDTAEGLLGLDVWNGAPATLHSSTPAPALADASGLDGAVEHIFSALQ